METFSERLSIGEPGSVFLETVPRAGFPGKTLLFESPVDVIRCIQGNQVQSALSTIDAVIAEGYYVAGYLSYEAGAALQGIAYDENVVEDLMWFGVYKEAHELDREATDQIIFQDHEREGASVSGTFSVDRETYRKSIARVKHHIREGDVYQINYTAPYFFNTSLSAIELYASLRRRQRVDYAAIINTGTRSILSLSPELFFSRTGDRLTARPMKGTAARGSSELEDRAIRLALQADAKNRAENLMIVDLIRNDLSMLCQPGSVEVSDLFTAETYETVIQMTSTVNGTLRNDVSYEEIFKSIFPCGSITGAPKLRSMELIHEIESGNRGVYCGSVGYIGPKNEAVFNVAIRTIDLVGSDGRMGIGSGVVWDSDSDGEYDECVLKSSFLSRGAESETRDAFLIIETMLFNGGVELLPRHLSRLQQSARRFGYPCDTDYLRSELDRVFDSLETVSKVRIELDRQGRFDIEVIPIKESAAILKLCLSDSRIDSGNVFRRHKTSNRKLYNQSFALAVENGFDEVIFLNEKDEVAEGSRTNIFVSQKGAFATPPIESGALPGVYRQKMLDSSALYSERKLSLQDLIESDGLYICNAVWGWREAELDLSELKKNVKNTV